MSAYRAVWEREGATDHVRSAIARSGDDFGSIVSRVAPHWREVPHGRRYGSILEIGCGYGRIPLYLSHERNVDCDAYYGVDIAESMLRHLLAYRERYGFFPTARVHPLCVAADELPLEDDSVDCALSSTAFLHFGKAHLRRALAEVARVLRPGGSFLFEASFPNRASPANLPGVLGSLLPRRSPHYLKFYGRNEVRRLLDESGLAAKVGGYRILADDPRLLPKRIGPVPVPLARAVNARLPRDASRLAVFFSARSESL